MLQEGGIFAMLKKLLQGTAVLAISFFFLWLDLTIASMVHYMIAGVNTPTTFGYLAAAVLTFFATPAMATYLLKDRQSRKDALIMCGYIGIFFMSALCLLSLPFKQYMNAVYDVLFAVTYLCILKYAEAEKIV